MPLLKQNKDPTVQVLVFVVSEIANRRPLADAALGRLANATVGGRNAPVAMSTKPLKVLVVLHALLEVNPPLVARPDVSAVASAFRLNAVVRSVWSPRLPVMPPQTDAPPVPDMAFHVLPSFAH